MIERRCSGFFVAFCCVLLRFAEQWGVREHVVVYDGCLLMVVMGWDGVMDSYCELGGGWVVVWVARIVSELMLKTKVEVVSLPGTRTFNHLIIGDSGFSSGQGRGKNCVMHIIRIC